MSISMEKHGVARQRVALLPGTVLRGSLPLLLLFFLQPLLLPACSGMPQGNPDDGERWYRLNRCDGCHGEDGTGGRGPVLAPIDLSFNRFVRKIRSPDSTVMPAYDAEQLPDDDAADIYLWLMSREK